jgi:hypothetical protein
MFTKWLFPVSFRMMAGFTQLAAILAAVLIGEFPTCLGKFISFWCIDTLIHWYIEFPTCLGKFISIWYNALRSDYTLQKMLVNLSYPTRDVISKFSKLFSKYYKLDIFKFVVSDTRCHTIKIVYIDPIFVCCAVWYPPICRSCKYTFRSVHMKHESCAVRLNLCFKNKI